MTKQQLKDKAHLDAFVADVEVIAKKHGVETWGLMASYGGNGKTVNRGNYRVLQWLWREHQLKQVDALLNGEYTCGCEKPNPRFLSWSTPKKGKKKG